MTTFFIIRHGLTDAVAHQLVGTSPGVHLNAAGRQQAADLAERLRDVPLDLIVASPLERARETAAPIAAMHGLEVEIDPAFIEFEFGRWTGALFADLVNDDGWRRFSRVRSLTPAPGGESMLDVQRRSMTALVALASRVPAGNVAVVSHGDVIRAMLFYVLGIPIDFVHRVEVAPSRISIVEIGEAGPRVRLVNADGVPPLA